jgi:signal transduction histidine kinase
MTRNRLVGLLSRGTPWLIGLTVGLVVLRIASLGPGFSWIARSPLSAALSLAAGWSLIAVGLVSGRREPANREGVLLVLAGLSWFAAELSNPATGSAVIFTVGLILTAACPPLAAHAALAYPSGRLSGPTERVAIGSAYLAGVVWSGILATVVYDPTGELCAFCPANLVSIGADPTIHELVARIGLVLAVAWMSAVIALAGRRVIMASAIRRRLIGPVLVPAAVFVGLGALGAVAELRGVPLSADVTSSLRGVQAIALASMAAGVAWPWLRARRTRTAIARLVVELGTSQASGDLREVLARELDDPDLEVAFVLADGRFVARDGHEVDVGPDPRRAVTPLVRGPDVVVLLRHRRDLLDDPERIDDVVAALRLTLEGERLRAELHAQLGDLRASRVRIVEAADAERRRLERDLHDGAQQRLVGLAMALRLLDRELEAHGMESSRRLVAEASHELRAGIAELRDLAHGIYPAALSGEGLAAALEALKEASTVAIELGSLPTERFDPRVEAAAYFVVAETLRRTAADTLRVAAEHAGDRLVIEIEQDGAAPDDLVTLDDRVGALDGTIGVHATPTSHSIRAEMPCAS